MSVQGGLSDELRSMWDRLQNSDIPPPAEDMAKWEAQFNQLMNSQREDLDFDYGGMMRDAWESQNDADYSLEPPMQFDGQGVPKLDPYAFGMSTAVHPDSESQEGSRSRER